MPIQLLNDPDQVDGRSRQDHWSTCICLGGHVCVYFILSKPYAFANVLFNSVYKNWLILTEIMISSNCSRHNCFFFCWSFFLSCFLQWGGRLLFEKILASFCRKLFAVTPSESKTRRGEGLCLFFCFDSFIKVGLPNHKECSTDTQSSGKQSTDQVEVCYSEFRGYSSRHAIANKPAWRGVSVGHFF